MKYLKELSFLLILFLSIPGFAANTPRGGREGQKSQSSSTMVQSNQPKVPSVKQATPLPSRPSQGKSGSSMAPKRPGTLNPSKPRGLVDKTKATLKDLFQKGRDLVRDLRGATRCGDGTAEGTEECDDGNTSNGDGCSMRCAWEVRNAQNCGNGICEVDEDLSDRLICNTDCCENTAVGWVCQENIPHHTIRCGDAVVEGVEECDDGNTTDGDGCNRVCLRDNPDCGNGIAEARNGEECDDGNSTNGDGCSSTCQRDGITVCGNGVIEGWAWGESPREQCDDGNTADGDGCDSRCQVELTDTSISGEDRLLCSTPNPADLPAGTHYWDYPDAQHISRCESVLSVRYVICNASGEVVTVNHDPCPECTSCAGGVCIRNSYLARLDTDEANSPTVRGIISGRTEEGCPYYWRDECGASDSTTGVACYLMEYISEHGHYVTNLCGPGTSCVDGACVPGGSCVAPTCTDSDEGDRGLVRGTISGTRATGSSYSFTDSCVNECNAEEYDCPYRGGSVYYTCRPGTSCVDGACVPGGSCGVEPTTCTRTSSTSSTAGYVTGSDRVIQHDICDGSTKVTFACGADGMPVVSDRTECPSGCRDGLCL